MPSQPLCFVVMPFAPELHFFYLFLQRHLQEKHALRVERGDSRVLTKPLLEKIRAQILEADLILADVSLPNPNVFYEIGLAHALDKPVVFLTQGDPRAAPVDIGAYEFIRYDLQHHKPLLVALDNAIGNAFVTKYRPLYEAALQLLGEFNASEGAAHLAASEEDFRSRVVIAEQPRGIPARADTAAFADFVIPKILYNPSDLPVMRRVAQWVDALRRGPAAAGPDR